MQLKITCFSKNQNADTNGQVTMIVFWSIGKQLQVNYYDYFSY